MKISLLIFGAAICFFPKAYGCIEGVRVGLLDDAEHPGNVIIEMKSSNGGSKQVLDDTGYLSANLGIASLISGASGQIDLASKRQTVDFVKRQLDFFKKNMAA